MDDRLVESSHPEWHLGTRQAYGMAPLAVLVSCLGLYGFGRMSRLLGFSSFSVRVTPDQAPAAVAAAVGILFAVAALTAGLVLLHEWVHAVAYRMAGAAPRYGAKMVGWFFPVVYVTAPGRWLTRRQYAAVLLAPTIAVNVVGLSLMAAMGSWSWMLVFPLASHLGGCVGDWWIAAVLARLPAGARIEDTPQGFRFRAPRP